MKRSIIACLMGMSLVPALIGCSGKQAGALIASPPPAATASPATVTPTAAPVVQTPPAASAPPTMAEATPPPAVHPDSKTAQTLASSGGSTEESNVAFDKLPSYTSEHPALVGITLGESQATVEDRFGKPKSTYTMDGDGGSSIQVDDFATFTVGFDGNHAVLFVDVNSAELDPRLNGLRLGKTADDARKALGKPDSSSAYVLSYESKKTVLKLDLDPRTKAILSIKLFGRSE